MKLGVSTKAAMALLSVLGDAAIDEERSQANSARSDSRHRQTVVKRNSDHKDDPPPRLPVIVKDSNRRYRKGA